MNKEFVTYNQSLALKELGFDEPCLAKHDLKHILLRVEECKSQENAQELDYILAPLYQQAFRWFRDKGFGIEIYSKSNDNEEWYYLTKKGTIDTPDKPYNLYEEAESACLDKLIEILKTKTND